MSPMPSPSQPTPSYREMFDRNLGLLTDEDVERIREARVGIGGLGGCGSNHLLALVRMGFERFVLTDPDVFDVANLNRQAGATLSTIGRPKVDVMQEMARDINPRVEIDVIPGGITADTVEEFVERSDIGINAIDFLRADLYPLFHDTFRRRGKHSVVGASPFAFGAAMTVIGPQSPSFAEFLGLAEGENGESILRKFVARMTPDHYAARYLPPGLNEVRSPLTETRVSSTAAALHLCTALTAAEVLFISTGRREPTLAPAVLQIDLLLRELSVHPGS